MPVASASFQPAGEEELELLLAPGTVTGFKGVQEVKSGCYQAKLRNGSSFVSLPSSRSILIAAWFYGLCQGVQGASCRRCGICGAQGECQQGACPLVAHSPLPLVDQSLSYPVSR